MSESAITEVIEYPSENKSALETPDRRKATMMILEIRKNWESLTLKAQNESQFVFQRPTDSLGGIDNNQHLLPRLYNTTNFVLHWTNGTDGGNLTDAVPLDDTNADSIPDYVEDFALIFENVWNFEANVRGFNSPPSDIDEPDGPNKRNPDGRYDVFIYDMVYYGYTDPEDWPDSPSRSYIAVDNDYEGFPTPQLEAMQVTAAHEFFHACQFVYDCTEERWWMEATATYMEDEVYPYVNDNYQYLPSWFLFSDTYGLESTSETHEYGSFIFAKHLSEDFSDGIIREIWEEMNHTNGLTAIDNVLISKNSSLIDEFSKFITANFFLEDFYVDGIEYRQAIANKSVWIDYYYDAYVASDHTEINDTNVRWDAWMDKFAADYITMKLNPAKFGYRIDFSGLDFTTNYLVKLVTKKAENITERKFELDIQKNGHINLTCDTFDNVTLIIANAGNTSTTDPSWEVTITTFSPPIYDIALTNVIPSTYSAFAGQTININVTAKNNGTTRYESFNVSVYWGEYLIETVSVTDLPPNLEEILNIVWEIPYGLTGNETIWANATILEEDANPTNNKFEDGTLFLATGGRHDVAVVSTILDRTVVGQNFTAKANTKVENQGDFTETIDVTLYINSTAIETQTVNGILSGTSVDLIFYWNTTGFKKGNYTITVCAWQVLNETDIDDNTYISGNILVATIGDITGNIPGIPDGRVDIRDIATIALAFGSYPGHPKWNPNADITSSVRGVGDNKIDIQDIATIAIRFGIVDS